MPLICRPTGDKCKSKTLFLAIFDLPRTVRRLLNAFSIAAYPVCELNTGKGVWPCWLTLFILDTSRLVL